MPTTHDLPTCNRCGTPAEQPPLLEIKGRPTVLCSGCHDQLAAAAARIVEAVADVGRVIAHALGRAAEKALPELEKFAELARESRIEPERE